MRHVHSSLRPNSSTSPNQITKEKEELSLRLESIYASLDTLNFSVSKGTGICQVAEQDTTVPARLNMSNTYWYFALAVGSISREHLDKRVQPGKVLWYYNRGGGLV